MTGNASQASSPNPSSRSKDPWTARDNVAGAHADVLSAISAATARAAAGELGAYGNDAVTRQAVNVLRGHFGSAAEVYFGPTGTFVNILGCSLLGRPARIITTPNSHLVTMESGGPEIVAGATLITAKAINGKIDFASLQRMDLTGVDMLHVSQVTEYGTVYTVEELRALGELCKEKSLVFGMDGARLPHAAVALDKQISQITADVGVDFIATGTAKCGGNNGNVLAVLDRARSEQKGASLLTEPRLYELIKLRGGTQSMMWQISSQFIKLYEGDLWKRNVTHAVGLAAQMRDELHKHGIETAFPAESNAIFLKVGEVGQERLGRYWNYFRWLTDPSLIRFMFAYNTPKEIVPMLVRDIVELRDQGLLDN
jgi:threonine aldolase